MKCVSKVLTGGVAIASLSFLAPSHSAAPVVPSARIVSNGTQLELQWSGRKTTIAASSLNAQIIEGVDCTQGAIAPRQTLSGQRFFGNRALSIDPLTGNVAVGVVLQDCFDTFTSAVFVIDPQSPGTYAIYRVPVPGTTALPDEFSTFPLNAILRVRYLDGDLLIKQGSTAVSSEALLVFTPGTTPAGQYAGCVVTRQDEGRSLCPERSGN
ncbi:MAG: hypothetical protein KME11_06615 [Timaviella obliquedivisa GSE-PSE-MK23-08B]|jgi:hypothetical protein|nr:hypothetical protein [Timaviella obliquedivisa GSE-PSE-MK23-08B]